MNKNSAVSINRVYEMLSTIVERGDIQSKQDNITVVKKPSLAKVISFRIKGLPTPQDEITIIKGRVSTLPVTFVVDNSDDVDHFRTVMDVQYQYRRIDCVSPIIMHGVFITSIRDHRYVTIELDYYTEVEP